MDNMNYMNDNIYQTQEDEYLYKRQHDMAQIRRYGAVGRTQYRTALDRFLSVLTTGMNVVQGGIEGAVSPTESVAGGIWKGLRFSNPLGNKPEGEAPTFGNNLGLMGWNPTSTPGKIARGIVGFAGDVLLDPTTYVTGGVSSVFRGSGKIAGIDEKIAKGLVDAKEYAKYTDAEAITHIKATRGANYIPTIDEIADQTRSVNKLRGIPATENPIRFSTKNRVIGKFLGEFEKTLIPDKILRDFGDKTIAPYFNLMMDNVGHSEKFSTKGAMIDLARKNPRQLYNVFKLPQMYGAEGFDYMKNVEELAKKHFKDVPAEHMQQVLKILQNPDFWKTEATYTDLLHTEYGIDVAKKLENKMVEYGTESTKLKEVRDALFKPASTGHHAGDNVIIDMNGSDIPAVIEGEWGTKYGIKYYKIKGSNTGIPENQIKTVEDITKEKTATKINEQVNNVENRSNINASNSSEFDNFDTDLSQMLKEQKKKNVFTGQRTYVKTVATGTDPTTGYDLWSLVDSRTGKAYAENLTQEELKKTLRKSAHIIAPVQGVTKSEWTKAKNIAKGHEGTNLNTLERENILGTEVGGQQVVNKAEHRAIKDIKISDSVIADLNSGVEHLTKTVENIKAKLAEKASKKLEAELQNAEQKLNKLKVELQDEHNWRNDTFSKQELTAKETVKGGTNKYIEAQQKLAPAHELFYKVLQENPVLSDLVEPLIESGRLDKAVTLHHMDRIMKEYFDGTLDSVSKQMYRANSDMYRIRQALSAKRVDGQIVNYKGLWGKNVELTDKIKADRRLFSNQSNYYARHPRELKELEKQIARDKQDVLDFTQLNDPVYNSTLSHEANIRAYEEEKRWKPNQKEYVLADDMKTDANLYNETYHPKGRLSFKEPVIINGKKIASQPILFTDKTYKTALVLGEDGKTIEVPVSELLKQGHKIYNYEGFNLRSLTGTTTKEAEQITEEVLTSKKRVVNTNVEDLVNRDVPRPYQDRAKNYVKNQNEYINNESIIRSAKIYQDRLDEALLGGDKRTITNAKIMNTKAQNRIKVAQESNQRMLDDAEKAYRAEIEKTGNMNADLPKSQYTKEKEEIDKRFAETERVRKEELHKQASLFRDGGEQVKEGKILSKSEEHVKLSSELDDIDRQITDLEKFAHDATNKVTQEKIWNRIDVLKTRRAPISTRMREIRDETLKKEAEMKDIALKGSEKAPNESKVVSDVVDQKEIKTPQKANSEDVLEKDAQIPGEITPKDKNFPKNLERQFNKKSIADSSALETDGTKQSLADRKEWSAMIEREVSKVPVITESMLEGTAMASIQDRINYLEKVMDDYTLALSNSAEFERYMRITEDGKMIDDIIADTKRVAYLIDKTTLYSEDVVNIAKEIHNKFADVAMLEKATGHLDHVMEAYVAFIVTPEAKAFIDSVKEIKEPGAKQIFNGFNIDRKYVKGTELPNGYILKEGTIEEINGQFREMVHEATKKAFAEGKAEKIVDDFKMFHDNISDIYLTRMQKHYKLMYDDAVFNDMQKKFGIKWKPGDEIGYGESTYVSRREIDDRVKIDMRQLYKKASREGKVLDYEAEKAKLLSRYGLTPTDMESVPFGLMKVTPEQASKLYRMQIAKPGLMADITVDKAMRLAHTQMGEDVNGLLKAYDKFMHVYKMALTQFNPSFHVSNIKSGSFVNYLDVGTKAFNKKYWVTAIKMLKNDAGEVVFNGTKYTIDDLLKEAYKHEIIGTGYFGHDVRKVIDDKLKGGGKTVNEIMRSVGSNIEDHSRLVNFLANVDSGKTFREAKEHVDKFLFDYNDITKFEHEVMQRIFPFYTWMRKNAPLQLETMATNPTRYLPVVKAIREIENMTDDQDKMDRRNLPAFAQDWVQLPFTVTNSEGGKEVMVWSNNLPYMDVNRIPDIFHPKQALSVLLGQSSPVIKIPTELATNYNFFYNKNIDNGRKVKDPSGKLTVSPKLAYFLNQIPVVSTALNTNKKTGIDKFVGVLDRYAGSGIKTYNYEKFKMFNKPYVPTVAEEDYMQNSIDKIDNKINEKKATLYDLLHSPDKAKESYTKKMIDILEARKRIFEENQRNGIVPIKANTRNEKNFEDGGRYDKMID